MFKILVLQVLYGLSDDQGNPREPYGPAKADARPYSSR